MTFTTYTLDNAPQPTHDILETMMEKYGFVPNFLGVFAGAPSLLKAYDTLDDLMRETSFSATERYIVLLSVSTANHCGYCVALHSKEAENDDVPIEIIDDLRAGTAIDDEKYESLRQYTLSVMKTQGRPSDNIKQNFIKAGYGPQQALEIILAIGMATLTNYANRLAHPALDEELHDTIWSQEEAA